MLKSLPKNGEKNMKRKKSKSRRHSSKSRASKRRSNPSRKHRRARKSRARRHNPVRRRKSHRRSNPGLGLKSALNKNFIMSTLAGAAGFVVGIKGTKYLLMIPGLASMNRFVGAIHLVLGGIIAAKAKDARIKSLGAGIATAGAFDLVAKNIAALGLPTLLGMDNEVAGDMMGANYLPGGTDVLGTEYAGNYAPGRTEVLEPSHYGSDVYADV
jgi:hypothetical protein